MSKFKIISLNCNSLISVRKRIHLQDYLVQYKPDIALLQETRLNPRHRIDLAGYSLVYIPIDKSNTILPSDVVTAVAVRNGIHHVQVHRSLATGWCSFVEISWHKERVLIGSFYLHPQTSIPMAEAALDDLKRVCSPIGNARMVGVWRDLSPQTPTIRCTRLLTALFGQVALSTISF